MTAINRKMISTAEMIIHAKTAVGGRSKDLEGRKKQKSALSLVVLQPLGPELRQPSDELYSLSLSYYLFPRY